MWFRHPAWIFVAWCAVLINVIGVWLAASYAEPWHATIHGVLGVLFAMWAPRLMRKWRESRGT